MRYVVRLFGITSEKVLKKFEVGTLKERKAFIFSIWLVRCLAGLESRSLALHRVAGFVGTNVRLP